MRIILITLTLILCFKSFGQNKDRILTDERAKKVIQLYQKSKVLSEYNSFLDSVLVAERTRFDSIKTMKDLLLFQCEELVELQGRRIGMVTRESKMNEDLYEVCRSNLREVNSKLYSSRKWNKILAISLGLAIGGIIIF